jgi:four helix bundle protein
MAKYQHFEELPVWQEASKLYNATLDWLRQHDVPLNGGFCNQLDRAALSVSNNIAEGFERATPAELLSFIAIARGSAGEVRSMISVVKGRPELKNHVGSLVRIRTLAESCSRQLTGWGSAIEKLPFHGRWQMPGQQKQAREAQDKAREFKEKFLRSLKPGHPLYASPEARKARGEAVE